MIVDSNLLSQLMSEEKLVSIYADSSDKDEFVVGYIDAVTTDQLRLRAISRYGEYHGYDTYLINDIFKLEYDDWYSKRLLQYSEGQGRIFRAIEMEPSKAESLIYDTLCQSLSHNAFIELRLDDPDETYVGFVESLSENILTFSRVDRNGQDDGIVILDADEITYVVFHSMRLQALQFLYQRHQGHLKVRKKESKPDHPYMHFEDTQLWKVVANTIGDLIDNQDLSLMTNTEHVVGYLVKQISESNRD